jgi:hypothetical protein
MSVQGPCSFPLRAYAPPALSGTAAPRAAASAPAPAAARKAEQAPADSSLWELLTEDERSFFSQQASLGALTYGRGRGAAPAAPAGSAPIGQRLDVRG